MIGIPFQCTISKVLRARLDYLSEHYQINEGAFITFDAMRQCSQCMGRVMRSKKDYGLMIFADKRFIMKEKVEKLPKWIRERLSAQNIGISSDIALDNARFFFKEMGQPLIMPTSLLLNEEKLNEINNKMKD